MVPLNSRTNTVSGTGRPKGGCRGIFRRGPNNVWGGLNCVLGGTKLFKEVYFSMQRHSHVKTLHRLEGVKSWFQSLWEGLTPLEPPSGGVLV